MHLETASRHPAKTRKKALFYQRFFIPPEKDMLNVGSIVSTNGLAVFNSK
jgi:hypothetical protein